MTKQPGHYIVLISVHGLIRGRDQELGRDADTGGQIKYVVELARALARNPDVWRVDLLTRQVTDPKVHADYGEHMEALEDGAFIIRLPCGPRRYLRKEVLWPYLDSFNDHALQHLRRIGRVPDVIHAHYADAGYVGSRLASLLGVPMIFTGHSLGRVKRQILMDRGMSVDAIESQYNISQRIEAEETALDTASAVVASTQQEVDEQYCLYDNYQPKRMHVIPPGVDLSRFRPPRLREPKGLLWARLKRFLTSPQRPMILALSRADERKNIATLVHAYANNPQLRELANLIIVAGNRDDIAGMEKGPRTVMTELLLLIDRYDLYGSVAYPKQHDADQVPEFYRLAARSHGVFVNPALTEPFGLTLIEAAASGLPILATADGGPRDILRNCKNGRLIDPLDAEAMGKALEQALTDRRQLARWAKSGIAGAHRFYSWESHVHAYSKLVNKARGGKKMRGQLAEKSRLPTVEQVLISDLDDTLTGDTAALRALEARLQEAGHQVGFGIATGRSLQSAVKLLKQLRVPIPDVLITSCGAEIHYGARLAEDQAWQRQINYRWEPKLLRSALRGVPGLKLQTQSEQHPFKISYFVDEKKAPGVRELVRLLRKLDLHANVIQSHGMFLDLLPIRASKGLALRHVALRWGFVPEHFLVAGGSGNDEDMLKGNTLGVVVGNCSQELKRLKGKPRIDFATGEHAWGILEGLDYYNFFGQIHQSEETSQER